MSNVGDNIWLHGLYVCPDIDTVLYGLAGILSSRGWGIEVDSFSFLDQMEKLNRKYGSNWGSGYRNAFAQNCDD